MIFVKSSNHQQFIFNKKNSIKSKIIPKEFVKYVQCKLNKEIFSMLKIKQKEWK